MKFWKYEPIVSRPPLRWPNEARVAVVIVVAFETWELVRDRDTGYSGGPGILPVSVTPGMPDYVNYTWREYGHRVGIWRLMDLFDRYGIRPSVALGVKAGQEYPEILQAMLQRDWELYAHSYEQDDLLTNYARDPAAEREVLKLTLDTFEQLVGKPSEGWISPSMRSTSNTVPILAELGVQWFHDYLNDDQPYLLDAGGGRTLVAVPWGLELNDNVLCMRQNATPEEYVQCAKAEFDVLYEEGALNGRIMNLGVHPHVLGRPHRVRSLERVIRYIRGHEKVWFAQAGEVARWFQTGKTGFVQPVA